jgi:diamine N-acetyltransferase
LEVELRPWSLHTVDVLAIEVTDVQRQFIDPPSVAEFLAGDDDHPTFTSWAVCDRDRVVGIVCYGQEPGQDTSRRWIPLLVIDREQQGKGYGRRAVAAVIERIRSESPACSAVGLSCKPDNASAISLYLSLGFIPAGRNARGEVEMWLELVPHRDHVT